MAYTYTPAGTNIGTAATTHSLNMPGTIASGNLLVAVVRIAAGGAVGWPDASWNEMVDASPDASDDQMAIAWKKADGSEGATISITSASGKCAAEIIKITGAADPTSRAPELSTVATGSSTTPDPTTCTPTGGSKAYLWIWIGGWEGEQTSPPTGNPTNFTGAAGANTGTSGLVATNCRVAVSFREFTGSSLDAGSWTISVSDEWTAYLMAVHPVPVGGGLFTAGGYYKA